MFLSILFCAFGGAEDTVSTASNATQQVTQQAGLVAERVDNLGLKLDAVERMLADQRRAELGLAPPGWVQPDFDMYLLPDSPWSFIPPEKAATTTSPTIATAATPRTPSRPVGPQP